MSTFPSTVRHPSNLVDQLDSREWEKLIAWCGRNEPPTTAEELDLVMTRATLDVLPAARRRKGRVLAPSVLQEGWRRAHELDSACD